MADLGHLTINTPVAVWLRDNGPATYDEVAAVFAGELIEREVGSRRVVPHPNGRLGAPMVHMVAWAMESTPDSTWTIDELADIAGREPGDLSGGLSRLVKCGLAHRVRRGVYQWGPAPIGEMHDAPALAPVADPLPYVLPDVVIDSEAIGFNAEIVTNGQTFAIVARATYPIENLGDVVEDATRAGYSLTIRPQERDA